MKNKRYAGMSGNFADHLVFIDAVATAGELERMLPEQAYGAHYLGKDIVAILGLMDLFHLVPKNGETFPEILEDAYQCGKKLAAMQGNALFTDCRLGLVTDLAPRNEFLAFSRRLRTHSDQGHFSAYLHVKSVQLDNSKRNLAEDYDRLLRSVTIGEGLDIEAEAQRDLADQIFKFSANQKMCQKGPAHALMWGCTDLILNAIRHEAHHCDLPLMVVNKTGAGGANLSRTSPIRCVLDLPFDDRTTRLPLTQPVSDPRALFNLIQISSQYHTGAPAFDRETTEALIPGMMELMKEGWKRLSPMTKAKKPFDSQLKPA